MPGAEPITRWLRHIGMTVFEIDVHEVHTAAGQLGAAATSVRGGATVLAQLNLSPTQAGDPDGELVSQAVQRFAERASRRLRNNGSGLRTHSVDLRTACTGYSDVDQSLAARLRAAR